MLISATTNTLQITALDQRRLKFLAATLSADEHMQRYAADLLDAVEAAKVVPSKRIPPDVVTMNTRVRYADLAAGNVKAVTLVYPEDADANHSQVSVLSPLGNALIAMKVGQTAMLRLPYGDEHRIRVAEILYQPEAEGHLTR